jgi:hypothetical protein
MYSWDEALLGGNYGQRKQREEEGNQEAQEGQEGQEVEGEVLLILRRSPLWVAVP